MSVPQIMWGPKRIRATGLDIMEDTSEWEGDKELQCRTCWEGDEVVRREYKGERMGC